MAGVEIDLIVRDICRLRPGIEGLSDMISVRSIVGRFLEHSRIYYFHADDEPEYYIGSADWMVRNLDNRVEAVVPIEDPDLREELDEILRINLADDRRAWELRSDGSYVQRRPDDDPCDTHERLMERARREAAAARDSRRRDEADAERDSPVEDPCELGRGRAPTGSDADDASLDSEAGGRASERTTDGRTDASPRAETDERASDDDVAQPRDAADMTDAPSVQSNRSDGERSSVDDPNADST
jgi:polyphosphate kinase